MNNLTEIKISSIPPRSKIGLLGDISKGKKLIEVFMNKFKFDFNILFSKDYVSEIESSVKYNVYSKSEEYNFVFNHLIKYIDYANYNSEYLIVFDDYFNNNYYLQKIYFSSGLTIITNNYLQLHLESMHNYIIIFYIDDINIQNHLYNIYFKKFFQTFQKFLEIYNILKNDQTIYSLVIHKTNDNTYLFYLKNTFYYVIEI
jgi:hypothetical protein